MFLFSYDIIIKGKFMQISISIEPYLAVEKDKLTQYIVDIVKLKQKLVLSGGEVSLHFDYFKHNPDVFALVQSFTKQIDIDLHLMQEPAPSFLGFRSVSFDAVDLKNARQNVRLDDTLNKTQRGLVLDLGYKVDDYQDLIRQVSYITLMTVKCGRSGQVFQESALQLVDQVRALNPDVTIIIDGGVNEKNINLLKRIGINIAVVGSYAQKNYEIGNFENSINRLLRD